MKELIFMLIFAISFIDNSFAQQNACDYKIEILINNSEFESSDFSWRIRATKIEGVPTNITGTAEIDDLNGQIIKRYKSWTNESISRQKTSSTYTPNLNQGEYKIISSIKVECDDVNRDNNVDIKIIKIKESNKEMSATISQNNNTIIDAKTNNTTKNETINPIIVSQKIESKTISKNESESIAGEEDNTILLRNDNKNLKNKLKTDAMQKQEIVYESSNEKAKGMIVISLLILSVLLNIVLIWRR